MLLFKSGQTELSINWYIRQEDLATIKTILAAGFGEKAYKNHTWKDLKLNPNYFREKYQDDDHKKHFIDEICKAEIEDIESGKVQCLVAKLGKQIVGCATYAIKPDTAYVYIDLLAVLPAYSQFGVGRKIIDAFSKKFSHLKGIVLYTRKLPTGAEIFYNKLGFQKKSLEELKIIIRAGQYPGFDSSINSEDYIGYEFPQQKLQRRHSLPDLHEVPSFKSYKPST